jgi:hypothetical protein
MKGIEQEAMQMSRNHIGTSDHQRIRYARSSTTVQLPGLRAQRPGVEPRISPHLKQLIGSPAPGDQPSVKPNRSSYAR